MLQVSGINEYLDANSSLDQYEYVHTCYKFDQDVQFIIVNKDDLEQTFARTAQDDLEDCQVQVQDVSPADLSKQVSYEELKILLETLDSECSRMAEMAKKLAACSDKEVMSALAPKRVVQSVKAISR